jgi:aminopeptidase-like protein
MTNFIAYADGKNDLFEISRIIGEPIDNLLPIIQKLKDAGLIKVNLNK